MIALVRITFFGVVATVTEGLREGSTESSPPNDVRQGSRPGAHTEEVYCLHE
jgi:hypothetical protein